MPRPSTQGHWLRAGATMLIASLALSACQFGSGAVPVQEITPASDQGARTTSTAVATNTVAGAAVTPTPVTDESATGETTSAPGSATLTVSPSEVALGNVVLTFSAGPAQPVFDPARVQSDPTGNEQQGQNAQPKGYAVLGGSALRVTNNFDAAQTAPADQPNQLLRHVALQVKDKQSGQLIPHVNVTIDLLREGRSVLQDQPLAPMVPADGGVAQLEYGNNVKFPGRGEYQVFVRIEPSPLLGSGATGVAQFNVSIK